MKNEMYPCLWFDGKAKASAEFYCSIFRGSKISSTSPMVVMFELNDKKILGLNSGPHLKLNLSRLS